MTRRYLDRLLWAAAGFLAAAVLSPAAIINQSEGAIFSSGGPLRSTSQHEASVDEITVAGTYPADTLKLMPGAGSPQRQHPQDFTMTLCFTPTPVGEAQVDYLFRWQDASNHHRIVFDSSGTPDLSIRWTRVKNGVSEQQAITGTIGWTAGDYMAATIIVSGVAPATVKVYTKNGSSTGCTLANGSITSRINATESAGTEGLASWTNGQDRLVRNDSAILWWYYIIQKADTYTLNGLPSTREAMLCTNGDVYLGKVTSAAPTFTFGTAALLPMALRIKVKTDTDADDCTTGTIHETYHTHGLSGGTVHLYRDETLTAGPAFGLPRYQTTTFDVPVWAAFNTTGSIKIGWKLQADAWPGTACTGTETCSAEKALTATASGLGVYRAFVTATGFAVSATYSIRVYHCVASVCTAQTDQLTVRTPAAPGTDGALTILFTTCHSAGLKPYVLWSRMAAFDADVTLLIGDLYYEGAATGTGTETGVPEWELIAKTRVEKEIKALDLVHEPEFSTYRLTHAIGYMWDDHDAGCDNAVPAFSECDEVAQGDSSLFTNAALVWDDYIGTGAAAEGLNPPALRTGTRYWASKHLNVEIIVPDHMTYRMPFQGIDQRKYGEVNPAALDGATATATDGTGTIDCTSGCDFVTEGVAVDDRAYFGSATLGRWYRVTGVTDLNTITVDPVVNCDGAGEPPCAGQTLDVVTTIKTMLGAQQVVDLSERLKATAAAQVYHAFSKGLYYTAGRDAWGTSGCEPTDQVNCQSTASYGYSFELLDYRTLACNAGATNNDLFVSGDSHLDYLVDHNDIASCSQPEVGVAGIGFPSYNNPVKYNYGNTMNSHDLRATASGRSFGITEIDTTGTDTIRTRVIGENGDVLLDTAQDSTAAFNVHASVTSSRGQPRHVVHSSGRCVTFYYNGTAQELVMSDPNCVFNPSSRLTATLTGRGLDLNGETGAIALNGDTVTACYVKGTGSADWYTLMCRTATINAATPSIAWNADETSIVTAAGTTFGTNLKIQSVSLVRGSDGFLYAALSAVDNNSPFYVAARVLRSATADTLTGTWTWSNLDNGETNAKRGILVNTGGTKILYIEQFVNTDTTRDLLYNEWTGSAWECAVNTMPIVKAGVTNANDGFPTAAGDDSGGALLTYLTDTSPGYVKAKPFTSNTSCNASEWGAEIVFGNTEPAASPTVSLLGGKYWILATNGLTSHYLYKAQVAAPTGVGDFLAGALTLPSHVKYGRTSVVANGASRLNLVADVAAYPNAPMTDSPMLKTFQGPSLAVFPVPYLWWETTR